MTKIDKRAFEGCTLESVTIFEGVNEISFNSFDGCDFPEIILPESLKKIDSKAFYGCDKLKTITLKSTTPPITKGLYISYENNENITIKVPASAVDTYKTAEGWSEYAANIVGY
ncbi:MAG: leucine-rich repeat domain-containing protein [Bacteroidales bacterium]|nr:leucine-rich repeat domain-containing protein [Bacteroidales bacterium]